MESKKPDTEYTSEIIEAATRLNIRPEAVQTYLDAGRGHRASGVERRFHTTIKPVGSTCDLDCSYCYYLRKQKLLGQKGELRISDETLERFIVDYIASQDVEEIVFTWHGGEPTLLGLTFFRKAVALQKKLAPEGRRVANDIQTNGLSLDSAWCDFFAENGFLVGLSVDGPPDLHDAYRRTKGGAPTSDKVVAAARLLRDHDVPFSTLTTVNRTNARQPLEVYRFLRDEMRTRFMQFIPCVEPLEFESVAPGYLPADRLVKAGDPRARPGTPMSVVTEWSVDPDDWGDFLCRVFDEWGTHDLGKTKINLFETLWAQLQGKPGLICSNSLICGKNIAVESDGGVFSCDHFVYPEYQLGRLGEGAPTLSEMMFSLKQLEFGLNKHNSLPSECRACRYLKLCGGECPRTRILKTREGEGPLSYLCSGWKAFYRHALQHITLQRAGAPR